MVLVVEGGCLMSLSLMDVLLQWMHDSLRLVNSYLGGVAGQ